MKIHKKGFTLAELLLCMGIIGIVTAMGMVITKHTTQKAYDRYWQTGYINLYNVLAECEREAVPISPQAGNVFQLDNDGHLQMQGTGLSGCIVRHFDNATLNGAVITVRNGITYISEKLAPSTYRITMRIPQERTRANRNGFVSTQFLYSYKDHLLIPIPQNQLTLGITTSLFDRADLLPFYSDNGAIGRQGTGTGFQKITKMSFRQAFCAAYQQGQKYAMPTANAADGKTGFYILNQNPPANYVDIIACPGQVEETPPQPANPNDPHSGYDYWVDIGRVDTDGPARPWLKIASNIPDYSITYMYRGIGNPGSTESRSSTELKKFNNIMELSIRPQDNSARIEISLPRQHEGGTTYDIKYILECDDIACTGNGSFSNGKTIRVYQQAGNLPQSPQDAAAETNRCAIGMHGILRPYDKK